MAAMGQARFDDAATLRAQRIVQEDNTNGGGGGVGAVGERHTVDDVAISKKSKEKDIATLLNTALDDPDLDENVSIRGIEHFVYPDLQQEMIRRKKELQREVLEFTRSSRPDPQGWRLAEHSRFFSLWARTVAVGSNQGGIAFCSHYKHQYCIPSNIPKAAPKQRAVGRLVWHSNIGASGIRHHKGTFFLKCRREQLS